MEKRVRRVLENGKNVDGRKVVTIKAIKRKFSNELLDFRFRNEFWTITNQLADYHMNPEGKSDYLVYPKRSH